MKSVLLFLILFGLTMLLVSETEAKETKKKTKKENTKTNSYDEKLDNLQKALDNWVIYAKKNRDGENVYQQLDKATRAFAEQYESISQDSENGKLSKKQYDRLIKIYDKYNNYLEQGY